MKQAMTGDRSERCACGADIPEAFCRRRGCCYECVKRQDGGPTVERHHVLGRSVSDTAVDMPANWHRTIDRRRLRRLRELGLEYPGDDPLHRIAAALAALAAAAEAFADYGERHDWWPWAISLARTLAAIGETATYWILVLAARLEEAHGPDWANALSLPEWRP